MSLKHGFENVVWLAILIEQDDDEASGNDNVSRAWNITDLLIACFFLL